MAASSSSTSNQFRLPEPTKFEDVVNLNPPSVETIETNMHRIITHYDELETRSDRGLQRLVRLAEGTTTAVRERTLSDRERMRSWHLLETEVKRAKEHVTTVHVENTLWMACAKVYNQYMWKYCRSLDKAVMSMDDLESKWAQERRYLISLCRRHIPADAAERVDLTEMLQGEMEGGDEEGEDVSLGYLANMYTGRVKELKEEVANLEQDNSALEARLILVGGEIPSAVARGKQPAARDIRGSRPSTARERAAEPSRVLHGDVSPNHYDAEAFTHVLDLYHHTRDLMHQMFTAHTINKFDQYEQWKTVWLNLYKQFEALRLLGTQLPASLTTRVAELDLDMGEPEHLRSQQTDPKWAPLQAKIKGEVAGKSKEELLVIVGECKATHARVLREVTQG